MIYSKDLILLLGVFEPVLRNLTAYQMMRLRWGSSQVPARRADQAFSLPNLGSQLSHWTFPAPKYCLSSIQTLDPLGKQIPAGGGYVALLSLSKLHCQPK
jgi:hypothetical protein